MIQYKLIKEYPGSPKLGTIEFNDYNITEPYVRHSAEWKGTIFYDAYPSFWEKVEELDYEILTVNPSEENKNNTNKEAVTTWKICNKDLKYWNIHSVKRLSDGEVFTIGDRVHQVLPLKDDNTWLIKEFSTKDTRCFTIGVNITCIEKSKTPLFTTEDGFEIFEDDNFFYINTHVWVVAKTNANMPMIHHVIEVNKYKTFSSEEKAEEYVLINKPMLSLQDLLNVWGVSDEIGAYKTSLMFNKFEKLAKSKL
jgi:hypothetical protein